MDSPGQIDLLLGAVAEERRPQPSAVRAQRGWWIFEDKGAAFRWAARNCPGIPAKAHGISAHPRPFRVIGGFCLLYEGCWGRRTAKFVLLESGALGLR